jgi:hypothetical protein
VEHRQRGSKWPRQLGLLVLIGLMVASLPTAHATPPISGQTIEFQDTAQQVGSHLEPVRSVAAGDLDGDGDLDLVSVGDDDKLNAWRNDGTPFDSAWTSQEVGSHTDLVISVAVGDLDGDGDPDIVSVGYDSKVNAWQNDGSPFDSAWTQQEVGSHAGAARSVAVGDLDGDGDLDLVSGGFDFKVTIWQNDGSPFGGTWTPQEAGSHAGAVVSLAAGDLDGDGDLDLVSGGIDDQVNVWQNDGTPFDSAWTRQEVGSHSSNVTSVAAGDLDGDGDLDLVSGGEDNRLNAWQNDGSPFSGTWSQQQVGSHAWYVYAVAAGDLDGDGDLDLVSGGWDMKVNVWQNDGSPFSAAWTQQEVGSHASSVTSVAAGDLDGDGDLDLVSGGYDKKINAWQNAQVHRNMPFNHTPAEAGSHTNSVLSVAAGDLDGDGDLDLVSGGYDDQVNVWRNDGSPFDAGAWASQNVGSHTEYVYSVATGDLDGDGDLDLVSVTYDKKINVWQNDGTPFDNAWTPQEVGSHASAVRPLAVGDLDGDGDLDLVSGGYDNKVIAWQNDGTPFDNAWTPREVGSHTNYVYSVAVGDLDGDGDLDIASGGFDNKANVWQNDGTPFDNAWTPQEVGSHTGAVSALAAGDLDGDGDLDLVSGGYDNQVFVWQNDGTPFNNAWTPQQVGSHTDLVLLVAAGDLDGDGDPDLVSSGRDDQVNVWRNDGSPFDDAWTQQEAGSHAGDVRSVAAGDLDGDGDLDLVSGGGDTKINAWQNQGGSAGMSAGDTAPADIPNGTEEDLLKVVFGHNGIAGDRDLELNRFDLHLFHSDCSITLTSAEANALVARLRVRLDDGDDLFETGGSDLLVADVDTLSLVGGVQAVAFADGDANVQVSAGNNKTYWISVLTTSNASSQSPNSFCLSFDPDADALVEGKADGLSEPDFSVSQQDTDGTNTGAVNTISTTHYVFLPLVRR